MSTLTRSKWFLLSFAILLVTNIVLLYLVFNKPAQNVEKKIGPSAQMIRDLDLDSTQQKLFRQQKDSFLKEMKPLWEDIRRSKYELYKMLSDTATQDTTIIRLAHIIGEKTAVSEIKQYGHFRLLRTLCTPQQQVSYDTLIPQLMSKYGSRARQKAHQ